jgi:hypothetical protein
MATMFIWTLFATVVGAVAALFFSATKDRKAGGR